MSAQSGCGLSRVSQKALSSSSSDRFMTVLSSSGPLYKEEVMAGIISEIVASQFLTSEDKWNLEICADVLARQVGDMRSLDWSKVVNRFDECEIVYSDGAFRLLGRFFRRVSGNRLPVVGLLRGIWKNRESQLFLLKSAANCTGEDIDLVDFSSALSDSDYHEIENAEIPPNRSWMCVALNQTLLGLAAGGLESEVGKVLFSAAEKYPEYVMLALARCTSRAGPGGGAALGLRQELLMRLAQAFSGLAGSRPTSDAVMARIGEVNQNLLVWLLRNSFKRCTSLGDVKKTMAAASVNPEVSKRVESEGQPDELLSLWCVMCDLHPRTVDLTQKLAAVLSRQPGYARPFAVFLRNHGPSLREVGATSGGVLSYATFNVVLELLQRYPAQVSSEEVLELSLFTRRAKLGAAGRDTGGAMAGNSDSSRFGISKSGSSGAVIAQDAPLDTIEAEANDHYMQLYQGRTTVADILQLLRNYKGSHVQREQEVFRCMLHNLFDEYRFFYNYPDRELTLTAQVFGGLVANQLVSSITLGIALRYALEALRVECKEVGQTSKMFQFGRVAVERFRARLGEWPQYCTHLLQISHLKEHAPLLHEDASVAIHNPNALAARVRNTPMDSVVSTTPTVAAAATPPAMMGAPVPAAGTAASASLEVNQPNLRLPKPLSFQGLSIESVNVLNSASHGGSSADDMFNLNMDPLVDSLLPLNFNPRLDSLPRESLLEVGPGETQAGDRPAFARVGGIDEMVRVNVDPSLAAEVPSDAERNPITFIINNIGQNNYEVKSRELKAMLRPQHYVWFASYVVGKRISAQPNLHSLYLAILDIIGSHQLYSDILDCTYFQVTRLLQSDDITSSSSERSLLRNLGMWLGQVTLARDKPILQRRIHLKELLFWGYETGRLIAVCSFVAKIIEGVRDSTIFRPPNPWLMAILGVLRDLYETDDLKMNIKFEVQVLCKNVNIRIEDVPKAELIPRCSTPVKDGRNPDFNLAKAHRAKSTEATAASNGGSPSLEGMKEEGSGLPAPGTDAKDQAVIPNLATYVVVNTNLVQLFPGEPPLGHIVTLAVDRAVRDVIPLAVETSVRAAVNTTKHVVLKDFAEEANEATLRKGAHLMVSQMAGGLALVTHKEVLRAGIGKVVRTLLERRQASPAAIDQAVQICVTDNFELACALVERAVAERAVRDLDATLLPAYQARRLARDKGVPYTMNEGSNLPYPLPDALKHGGQALSLNQQAVYDDFKSARSLNASHNAAGTSGPGGESKVAGAGAPAGMLKGSHAMEAYHIILNRLEQALTKVRAQAHAREVSLSRLAGDHEIMSLLRDVVIVTQRTQATTRIDSALSFAEIVFKSLVEIPQAVQAPDPLRMDVLVGCLEALRDACGGPKKFQPNMAAWLSHYVVFSAGEERARKAHLAALVRLIRAKLLRAQELDLYMAAQMDAGRNLLWVEFALALVRQCLVDGISATQEFVNTFDTVSKMRPSNVTVRKQLQVWLTDLRAVVANKDEHKGMDGRQAQQQDTSPFAAGAQAAATASGPSSAPGAGSVDATPGAPSPEHVTSALERWLQIWTSTNETTAGQYLQLLHSYGVLKTIEVADAFFRMATEICIDSCYKTIVQSAAGTQAGSPSRVNYNVIDALAKLFLLLMRLADKEAGAAQLLSRILYAIVSALLANHEAAVSGTGTAKFDQRPYFRLLSNLVQDLPEAHPKKEPQPHDLAMLSAYSHTLMMLVPQKLPTFAFSWLHLISHRRFMPHLLQAAGNKGWPTMQRLMVALLTFLQPYLKQDLVPEAVQKLYEGTMRVMLVLLHDFPEFLADYHASLCDCIPTNCVQMRNLVLSAFPRTMRLPDPFSPQLKVDEIESMKQPPRVLSDYTTVLEGLQRVLDSFLSTCREDLLMSLPSSLLGEGGTFNVTLINAVVLYVGAHGSTENLSNSTALLRSPTTALFLHLGRGLPEEGRYHLLNAMANQLRYPNRHTHFFSVTMLTLFAETDESFLREQITRVLLERLIVHRPHPWGLLVTFIELIKNPRYNFWKGGFTKGAPEIEKVFDTVARSCLGVSASALEAAATGKGA